MLWQKQVLHESVLRYILWVDTLKGHYVLFVYITSDRLNEKLYETKTVRRTSIQISQCVADYQIIMREHLFITVWSRQQQFALP